MTVIVSFRARENQQRFWALLIDFQPHIDLTAGRAQYVENRKLSISAEPRPGISVQ